MGTESLQGQKATRTDLAEWIDLLPEGTVGMAGVFGQGTLLYKMAPADKTTMTGITDPAVRGKYECSKCGWVFQIQNGVFRCKNQECPLFF